MIFVTLGTQKFQFNRLLIKIDQLIEKKIITEPVMAQIGYSDYIPKNYEYKDFMDRDEFNKNINDSNLIITHGGTGAIINSLKLDKKIIAVPRQSKYGEHVDNHQFQIVKMFSKQHYICAVNKEIDEIDNLLLHRDDFNVNKFKSNNEKFIKIINNYIESWS